MSQENVEIVRRSFEAWNQRDWRAYVALWHPEGEIDWTRSRGPLNRVYRGAGEREIFWNEFMLNFVKVRIAAHDFIEAGDEVVVPNTAHLQGRDGIEVTARSTLVFTVQNGVMTRIRLFQEQAEALEAVGLRE